MSTISKIILCPECEGKGEKMYLADFDERETSVCKLCKGFRVVIMEVTTTFKSIENA